MHLLRRIRSSARVAPILLRKPCENSIKRHGSVMYRQFTKPPRKHVIIGEGLMGFMWFWILWRFYHEPEEVFGHFTLPEPSQWTDAELGIPPDDID